jgi:hypothetical protein
MTRFLGHPDPKKTRARVHTCEAFDATAPMTSRVSRIAALPFFFFWSQNEKKPGEASRYVEMSAMSGISKVVKHGKPNKPSPN